MTTDIYKMFSERIKETPDALAVADENSSLTFRELDRLVDCIIAKFTRKPTRVGIVMEHSADMIAAILATLKCGAAYVPAEPSFPPERTEFMMREAGVDFIIRSVNDIEPREAMEHPDNQGLAYILYTSGTTGHPKGVMVTNANVCHYARAFANEFHPHSGDVMLQHSVCSFDIFTEEVFGSLLNGAALAIPSEKTKGNTNLLMQFIERHNVTMLSGFPYLLLEMNKLPRIPSSLRLLISGGDVLRGAFIDRLRNMGPMIYNTYGPSETTVCASYFRCDYDEPLADGTFSIGKAIKDVSIEIMDEDIKPVASGKTGEISIFGNGVSQGYLGDVPEQQNFTHTADGRRVYRSGDLGYLLPDGNIAFLHRKDTQVMIGGKRVECKEVENVICSQPEVEAVHVESYIDDDQMNYLVAYLVPKEHHSVKDLKKRLSRNLTPFMIPEFFISLSKLPLTPNGKINKTLLPVPHKTGHLYE